MTKTEGSRLGPSTSHVIRARVVFGSLLSCSDVNRTGLQREVRCMWWFRVKKS